MMRLCDFNSLSDEQKLIYHKQLAKCAASFGGTNFFLQLLEAIRNRNPHPLMAKNSGFYFDLGSIKWNKVIFKDKLTLLTKISIQKSQNDSLIPDKNNKEYKAIMNLLRTIKPITFEVRPTNSADGEGFDVHPFEMIGEKITRLDPVFDALFFCPVDTVKRVLFYKDFDNTL
jgi:hypothetical protein